MTRCLNLISLCLLIMTGCKQACNDTLIIDINKTMLFGDKKKTVVPFCFDSVYNNPRNKYLGWVDMPSRMDTELLDDIERTAWELRKKSDVFVLAGVGGSYLGARAAIEAMSDHFALLKPDYLSVLYVGNNMSENYYADLISVLDEKDYSIAVISKSGKTIETAIAFRLLKQHLIHKYGKTEAAERIVVITEIGRNNPLEETARKENYKLFEIPKTVGGRFSVISPVGLFPMAMAGLDIRELVNGAKEMEDFCRNNQTTSSPAYQYAKFRQLMRKQGKTIEILANYEPCMFYFAEWWKQLYGESLGKGRESLFPASTLNTTDLHSMGQYIQGCPNNLLETTISITNPVSKEGLFIPTDADLLDGNRNMEGMMISEMNRIAERSTIKAHQQAKIPSVQVVVPEISERSLGKLFYFFEMSCALNGFMIGINPFNQPNVDDYKTIMQEEVNKRPNKPLIDH